MRKSTWIAAIATGLILTLTSPALAAVSVNLNGQPLTFDVPPVVENGRTLVPVRTIFEALGARITWDQDSQTISAVHPERDKYVILKLGSTTAWVDGQQVTLDVAPKSVDGRTMVPLRFISTAMGAEVSYDAATETVGIKQAPLVKPAEDPASDESTASEQPAEASPDTNRFVDASMGETPDADLTNAQLLSRFTRSVAYTHLNKTYLCSMGMGYRFEEMEAAFADDDAEWMEETVSRLKDTVTCWDTYEQKVLPALPVPKGAEAAVAALQRWIDLNQNALEQLQLALQAHQKGDTAERNRLFQEGQNVLKGAVEQEQKMLAAMNAVTSDDSQFLTVDEHVYAAWLDETMGHTDNCFSDLYMVSDRPGEEARLAKAAADCMVGLPDMLREKTPPTARMKQLLEGVLTELAKHTPAFSALAAKVQAGPVDPAVLDKEIQQVGDAWYASRPTLDHLFVYRTYGKF